MAGTYVGSFTHGEYGTDLSSGLKAGFYLGHRLPKALGEP